MVWVGVGRGIGEEGAVGVEGAGECDGGEGGGAVLGVVGFIKICGRGLVAATAARTCRLFHRPRTGGMGGGGEVEWAGRRACGRNMRRWGRMKFLAMGWNEVFEEACGMGGGWCAGRAWADVGGEGCFPVIACVGLFCRAALPLGCLLGDGVVESFFSVVLHVLFYEVKKSIR